MDLAGYVQAQNEASYDSVRTNTFEKGIYPSLVIPVT